ncbi:phosphoribosylanthranilate isomerase [Methanosarcina sp.]|uniref:phosphoribosylanthranilate isomerase n=1 Tax=Methanosarcina sp. TaxID=2213 RepID=UPI00298878F1|nr:phosphoribosylanthranilate isomerase [Methanosarcina sp.]MDW5551742.1 phosphoribosylanthranilate isomerase [Methanosarcina sp.]MDW5555134.1 phosphoribosylanthranilate isomerase [Methanosarcina sp.]MDW5560820.1 phosphoribosylanthranilate isomerase [Methanosarcina sp.]
MTAKVKTRTKICGIRSPEEIELAAFYGADAVGFITEVPVKSPRKLDSDTAAYLVSRVPETLSSVLVIMPENADTALGLIEKIKPDIVQIHSRLPLLELEIIKEKTGISIIKTLSVPAQREDSSESSGNPAFASSLLEEVSFLEDSGIVDSILLDSARPDKPGGTGCVHDWTLSRRISEETQLPLILAGGLKPENVREAVRAVSPYAVDTASGVETCGKKDAVKIKSFIEEVRCANAFL